MGIQHLNRYLKEKCNMGTSNTGTSNMGTSNTGTSNTGTSNTGTSNTGAIKHISFNDLRGKRIAVDISIYMYKFSAEGALIDNMYQMIALFRLNGIIPFFVFDGKPPPEKKELFLSSKKFDEIRSGIILPKTVNYDEISKTIKQMVKADKERIGYKPEEGQNQWSRCCQNSGEEKKRRPQQYNASTMGDLLKKGYK